MQFPGTLSPGRLTGVAAVACTAALMLAASPAITAAPAAASGSAGVDTAVMVTLAASAPRPVGRVTVYVGGTGRISGRGTVTPIDAATGTALKRIMVGGNGGVIGITPNGKIAYVAGGRRRVTPIEVATGSTLKRIKVGANADAIAITPNGKTAYVVGFNARACGMPPTLIRLSAVLVAMSIGVTVCGPMLMT